MVQNSALPRSTAEIVLDARSNGRFSGSEPEPRPGLPSGHIPNSFSLPFNSFLDSISTDGPDGRKTYSRVKSPDAVQAVLDERLGTDVAGKVLSQTSQVVSTCGSGMTAATVWLGLNLAGKTNVAIYDESWTGYAMRKESKIAIGANPEEIQENS